jgi:transcriptional regulator with XRE-family HTH domain
MQSLLKQIKSRRLALKLKQSDMLLRAGLSRQQYQQIESKGNPRLNTLELVADGLDSELVLIPKEKLKTVRAILDDTAYKPPTMDTENDAIEDDPWKGLLEDISDD